MFGAILSGWFLASSAQAVQPELCGDSIDNDGDGQTDEAPYAWFVDLDGDGYGDYTNLLFTPTCAAPTGAVDNDLDCDDSDDQVNPDGDEGNKFDAVDQDCDFDVDNLSSPGNSAHGTDGVDSWFAAIDDGKPWSTTLCASLGYHLASIADQIENDGVYATVVQAGPTQFWIGLNRPASAWVWQDGTAFGYDNWASGEGSGGAMDDCAWIDGGGGGTAEQWFNNKCSDSRPYVCELACSLLTYGDGDQDGLGDPGDAATECLPSADRVLNDLDCDDGDDTLGQIVWYRDADSDGHGDPKDFQYGCAAPSGYVALPNDCDDGDGALNDDTPWYADGDGDGDGGPNVATTGCVGIAGATLESLDCDDGNVNIHLGAEEVCDLVDNDCDERIDDFDDDVTGAMSTFYPDNDHDLYGLSGYPIVRCAPPYGYEADYTATPGDCNDTNPLVNPGAPEQCDNGLDDDCDQIVDTDAVGDITFYADADADGHGDPYVTEVGCSAPDGSWVLTSDDCDDGSGSVYPGAAEILDDGIDQDCDGHDATSTGGGGTTPTTGGTGPGSTVDRDAAERLTVVGCGCDGTGAPPIAALGLVTLALRRRSATGRTR